MHGVPRTMPDNKSHCTPLLARLAMADESCSPARSRRAHVNSRFPSFALKWTPLESSVVNSFKNHISGEWKNIDSFLRSTIGNIRVNHWWRKTGWEVVYKGGGVPSIPRLLPLKRTDLALSTSTREAFIQRNCVFSMEWLTIPRGGRQKEKAGGREGEDGWDPCLFTKRQPVTVTHCSNSLAAELFLYKLFFEQSHHVHFWFPLIMEVTKNRDDID